MKNKDITTKNNKGQYHGYQQWYNNFSKRNIPFLRGNFKNNIRIGYLEYNNHGPRNIGDEYTKVCFFII